MSSDVLVNTWLNKIIGIMKQKKMNDILYKGNYAFKVKLSQAFVLKKLFVL